jgi:hypothetical protein
MKPAAAPPRQANTAPARPAPGVTPPAPVTELANTIRLTEEIRSNLYKNNPLIKAVIDQLGGSIVKLEE